MLRLTKLLLKFLLFCAVRTQALIRDAQRRLAAGACWAPYVSVSLVSC